MMLTRSCLYEPPRSYSCSTNLPNRSPALRTCPLVLIH